MPQTNTELIASITEQYRTAGNPWPATPRMVTEWALENGKLDPLRTSAVALYSRMFHAAWQSETFTDPQGRRVRKYHAARVTVAEDEELSLWTDIETASPEFMYVSLGNKRENILHACAQLKRDADSYNENYNTGRPIQISLNFTADVAAIEAGQQLLDIDASRTVRTAPEHVNQIAPRALAAAS
jgi:hypothetical protein